MSERGRCLIVDDEPSGRETMEAMLHGEGYALATATDGHHAIEQLRMAPPDVILCDVMMPRMDGFEFCSRVKRHPEWRLVPIILVTALDGKDDMVRGIDAGADEFLTKPVERVVLRMRVRAMLRVRAQYQQLVHRASDVESLLASRREQMILTAGLSDREREVLDLLLLGRTHDEIGLVLSIAERTVRYHQTNIFEKLGADSRNDLMRLFL